MICAIQPTTGSASWLGQHRWQFMVIVIRSTSANQGSFRIVPIAPKLEISNKTNAHETK